MFLPVNEWQWHARLQTLFAGELATGRLVPLRLSTDPYFAQQSIRTFVNAERTDRCCVKTTLSVLNTGQYRGLNPDKLALAPKMTGWMRDRLGSDPLLRELGFGMLGEVATVSYRHPSFDQNAEGPYQYREMLGALWREHPLGQLRDGERLMTMAALLYVDDSGAPLVGALAYRAGVTLDAWIKAYLYAYLTPLLHCFFKHETYFVAHSENTMLVLSDNMPKRIVLKDFVEEVQVSQTVRRELTSEFRAVLGDFEEELIPLFVLTDVFDGFFRYLADLLVTHAAWPEERFWQLVASVVRDYQSRFPELLAQYRRFDLFCAEFPRFCLNKYRLVYHGYADANASSWESNLRFSGTLPNPIAPFAG